MFDDLDEISYESGYNDGYDMGASQNYDESVNKFCNDKPFFIDTMTQPFYFGETMKAFKNVYQNKSIEFFIEKIEKLGFSEKDMFLIVSANEMNNDSFINLLKNKSSRYFNLKANRLLNGHIYHSNLSPESRVFFRILVSKCIYFEEFGDMDFGHKNALWKHTYNSCNKAILKNMFNNLSQSEFVPEIIRHFKENKKSLNIIQDIMNIPNLRCKFHN